MMKSKMLPRLMIALGLGIGMALGVWFVRERFTVAQIEPWVGHLGGWARV